MPPPASPSSARIGAGRSLSGEHGAPGRHSVHKRRGAPSTPSSRSALTASYIVTPVKGGVQGTSIQAGATPKSAPRSAAKRRVKSESATYMATPCAPPQIKRPQPFALTKERKPPQTSMVNAVEEKSYQSTPEADPLAGTAVSGLSQTFNSTATLSRAESTPTSPHNWTWNSAPVPTFIRSPPEADFAQTARAPRANIMFRWDAVEDDDASDHDPTEDPSAYVRGSDPPRGISAIRSTSREREGAQRSSSSSAPNRVAPPTPTKKERKEVAAAKASTRSSFGRSVSGLLSAVREDSGDTFIAPNLLKRGGGRLTEVRMQKMLDMRYGQQTDEPRRSNTDKMEVPSSTSTPSPRVPQSDRSDSTTHREPRETAPLTSTPVVYSYPHACRKKIGELPKGNRAASASFAAPQRVRKTVPVVVSAGGNRRRSSSTTRTRSPNTERLTNYSPGPSEWKVGGAGGRSPSVPRVRMMGHSEVTARSYGRSNSVNSRGGRK